VPEYPNIPFSDGQEYTAELAYKAFYCPVFDGATNLLGHREAIRDDELSNTGIKADVITLRDGFKCTAGAGLVINYSSGIMRDSSDNVITKAAGQVLAPDNATSYVYIDGTDNTIKCSVTRSVLRATLAKVVTLAGNITSIADQRHPATVNVRPPAFIIKSFGGQSTTIKICTQGETLKGVIECGYFEIPAGVTVTVDRFAKVICSGAANIYGTANVTPQTQGHPRTSFGLFTSGGYLGYQPGEGLGKNGVPYHYTQQPYGSSGGIGYVSNRPGNTVTSWCYQETAGHGGGAFSIEAAGAIRMYASAVITAKGTNGAKAGSTDAGVTLQCIASGSGGGSGGLVSFVSATSVVVEVGATVDVRGGNGGDGYIHTPGYGAPLVAAPGTPGGGGYFVTIAPTVNTTGFTFLNAGGTHGLWGSHLNGVTIVNSTTISFLDTTYGLVGGGLGGAFGGAAGGFSTYFNGTPQVDYVIMLPGGAGVHHISNSLPTA